LEPLLHRADRSIRGADRLGVRRLVDQPERDLGFARTPGTRRRRQGSKIATRTIQVLTATLLLVVPAALLTTGNSSGLYWEVAGTGFCLVAGMTDAWVLLCEILR